MEEVGEEAPADAPREPTELADARYLRLAFEDQTRTILLRGARSKLPFSVGDEVHYTFEYGAVAWSIGDIVLTLRGRDDEVLLQYGYLGKLEAMELPPGLELDLSEEVCLDRWACGGSKRAATFREAQGESTRIEPGEARTFADFDIYLHRASIVPEGDLDWRTGLDCRWNTIDLLLLRRPN